LKLYFQIAYLFVSVHARSMTQGDNYKVNARKQMLLHDDLMFACPPLIGTGFMFEKLRFENKVLR
jgi:hypothetical protein